jgi:hypothetical protein
MNHSGRSITIDVVLSAVLFTMVLLVVAPPDRMLEWDEVDYIVAARQGLWANAVDATSLSLQHFVILALAKAQGLPPPPVPSGYNETVDLFHLRHFHPPLLQYLGSIQALIPVEKTRLATALAFGLRWFCGAALIAVSLFTANALFGALRSPLSRCLQAAIAINAAWLLSFAVQYHVLMAISLLLVAYSLCHVLEQGDRRSHLWISASLALAVLSLETSLVVVAASFVILMLRGRWISKLRQAFVYTIFLPFVISFLFWPASLIKLSLLRTYGMHIYRVLFVKEEYTSVFSWATVEGVLVVLAPLALIGLLTAFASASTLTEKLPNRNGTRSLPLAVFTLLGSGYSFFMLPFVLNTTYMVPGLLVLALPLPYVLETYPGFGRMLNLGLTGLVVAASINTLTLRVQASSYPSWSALPSLGTFLSSMSDGSTVKPTIYADGGHILRFYLPEYDSQIADISRIDQDPVSGSTPKLFTRKNLQYMPLELDQIRKPALLIVREHYASMLMELGFPCKATTIADLSSGAACEVR